MKSMGKCVRFKHHDELGFKPKLNRSERVKCVFPVKAGDQAGITRDVSNSGLYIELPKSCEIGSKVPLEVELEISGKLLHLKVLGEVVRVEKIGGAVGVGLRVIEQSLFERIGL